MAGWILMGRSRAHHRHFLCVYLHGNSAKAIPQPATNHDRVDWDVCPSRGGPARGGNPDTTGHLRHREADGSRHHSAYVGVTFINLFLLAIFI